MWQPVYFLSCSKSGATDERDNATSKALDMSLQYSFVTPLTSMVVTRPETENDKGPLIADKLTEGKGGKTVEKMLPGGLFFSPEKHSALTVKLKFSVCLFTTHD